MFKKFLAVLISGVFVFGLAKLSFAAGCGMEASHGQTVQTEHSGHTEPEAVTQATSKAAVNVGNKICPVSGEKVDGKTTYEYQGKIYNFCCPECIPEFKKDPQKYIKKVEEEKKSTAPEQKPQHSH